MQCKVCDRYQEAEAIAAKPDSPEMLLGLTEAGMRNRGRQREERILKAGTDYAKHRRSCLKREEARRLSAEDN